MIGEVVTIDGPAGSGKSTVARRLAARLGWAFLDTGAMYRGLTAWALDRGIAPADSPDQVAAIAERLTISFDWTDDPPRLRINERDMMDRLRAPDVAASVSDVASIASVRRILVGLQRAIASDRPRLVSEGRDQGSVVFPDALVKFFLDAAPEVRAARRAAELRAAGQQFDDAQILDQILRRDERDRNRSDGPLICPADAVVVETGGLTLDQVTARLEEETRKRLGSSLTGDALRADS
ncbi:MAG: (d)CMP kinase [Phycisphaeraceae bacterium]|nr:(d)CMP kinase [Phycisphaeraceae bacterium]